MEGFQFELGADNRRLLKKKDSREAVERELRCVIRDGLTERQRETFMLYYGRKMKMPQIAEIQKVSVSTVSRSLQRARRRIDERLCRAMESMVKNGKK